MYHMSQRSTMMTRLWRYWPWYLIDVKIDAWDNEFIMNDICEIFVQDSVMTRSKSLDFLDCYMCHMNELSTTDKWWFGWWIWCVSMSKKSINKLGNTDYCWIGHLERHNAINWFDNSFNEGWMDGWMGQGIRGVRTCTIEAMPSSLNW